MYDSRYSKFLTILLIVIIVLIVGLLIFWGVDSIKKYNINNDAQAGIDAFKNQIQNGVNNVPNLNLPADNNINNNIVDIPNNSTIGNNVVIVNPYENLVTPDDNTIGNDGNNGNGNNGVSSDGSMYKGFKMVGYIEIPKTDVELPILDEEAFSDKGMDVAIPIMYSDSGLNKPGVTVLAGHNYKNNTFFSNNAKLSIGDKVYITDSSGKRLTYEIYKKYEAGSEHADYINVDANGKCELVLTTCATDSDYRTIICAREVEK